MIRRTITAHISPYFGGLAPETHDFVRHLNEEAKRLRTGVSFIALANRILATGNLERALKFANTLGGLHLRRAIASGFVAHRPQPKWETAAIGGEEAVLRRGNSQHRKELRWQEKNRPPVKDVGPFDTLRRKVEIANETLYHLICAIPSEKRDREEIYPADFSTALIPLPQRTNWPADRLARWRRQGRLLCGVSHAALHGHDSLKLRDFSEPTRLLFRYGRYEVVTRQQAASPVRDILTITSELAELPAIETRLALYLWERLTPLETQQVLKRIGRLYKNSCWWSKRGARRLFDKAWASSDKKRWVTQQDHLRVRLDAPEDDEAAKWRQVGRDGGRVIYLGNPAKRHASLATTRAAYNERYESYLNSTGLGKTLRLRGSLNIPRETIEVRNNMIANLERDFGLRHEEVVA